MTRWRWAAISSEIDLVLSLDSDDPEIIARVESSAKANGITLTRMDDDEGWPEPAGVPTSPIPPDYWETAE